MQVFSCRTLKLKVKLSPTFSLAMDATAVGDIAWKLATNTSLLFGVFLMQRQNVTPVKLQLIASIFLFYTDKTKTNPRVNL